MNKAHRDLGENMNADSQQADPPTQNVDTKGVYGSPCMRIAIDKFLSSLHPGDAVADCMRAFIGAYIVIVNKVQVTIAIDTTIHRQQKCHEPMPSSL